MYTHKSITMRDTIVKIKHNCVSYSGMLLGILSLGHLGLTAQNF